MSGCCCSDVVIVHHFILLRLSSVRGLDVPLAIRIAKTDASNTTTI